MKTRKRSFKEETPIHVYEKGDKGHVLFYLPEDYILYFTLHSCVCRARGVKTLMFCLMPNHVHSSETAEDIKSLVDCHRDIESKYAIAYNLEHKRKGRIFNKSFGSAVKPVGKRIRDNLSYIANNPVVGNLSSDITDYRWNLLAYKNCKSPFSTHGKPSSALRKSMRLVNELRKMDKPLTYGFQRRIFRDLSYNEKKYLGDYIISKYNFVDYEALAGYYGSFENALNSIRANSGSEYDIKEDWEDYSVYPKMTLICKSQDIDMSKVNFKELPPTMIDNLKSRFKVTGASERQIEKFLQL